MNKIKLHLILLVAVPAFVACNDYLDVKPHDRLIPKTANDFRALMTTAYNGIPKDKAIISLRTDEVKLNESIYELTEVQDIYLWNDVNYGSKTLQFSWQAYYKTMMYANHVIHEGLNAMEGTEDEINQIVGEAYMLRALMHFNLVNLYAKTYNATTAQTDKAVPLSLKIDTEAKYPASSVAEVYKQIILDVKEAEKLVHVETYEKGLNYRFSKLAMLAFQSRMYLYMENFEKAKSYALEVLKIKNTLQDLGVDASISPHRYDADESILALEGITSVSLTSSALLSDKMKTLYNWNHDLRFALNYNESEDIPGEFIINRKDESAYKCTFRIAEMYLIVAECAARQNELHDAKNYLNQLKAKRLKPRFYATEVERVKNMNKDALIEEIFDERLREFAFEGHRWFDLRRTNGQEITHSYKGTTEKLAKNDPRYTLPYPQEAIDNNANLNNW